ncbi:MAG TPA: hypothetical protein VI793_21390 [Anaerolineales bacterium]|nr:hypothetical protein [Anaerolineales bacterium]
MKIRFGNALLTAIAAGVGFVTLLGYFVNAPILRVMRQQLVAWASLLAAVAVIIGALNLLQVHLKKMTRGAPGWFYSLFLILSLVGTLGVGIAAPFVGWGSGPTNTANAWVFHNIQSALGAAIAGLLFFFLVFAGYRLLRRRASLTLVVFVVAAIISLIGAAPLPAGVPDFGLRDLRLWLAQVPAVAGGRGLLLGVALGVIATGLRILLAVDRPYGE